MDDSKSVSIISFHEFSRLHSLNAGFSYFQTKKGKKKGRTFQNFQKNTTRSTMLIPIKSNMVNSSLSNRDNVRFLPCLPGGLLTTK